MGDGSVGEEKSALEAWKKEAQDNMRALEDIQKIASLSSTLSDYEDFNADGAWDSFSASIEDKTSTNGSDIIEEDSTPVQKTSIFSIGKMARIAAVLVAVVGCLFMINLFLNPSNAPLQPKTYSASAELMNIELSDGSDVTLDKKSDLKVLDDRTVSLSGRAHFDVERDETKQFSIDIPLGKVVVLGTEFTIDADENTTEVYVKKGSVRYELSSSRTWTMQAGDLVRVTNKNEVAFLEAKDDNIDSWKNQTLIFRDNNMVEVVDALSRHFKSDVIIENQKEFSKCNVVNTFTNSSLTDILNDLAKTHGLKYEIRENKVYIVSAKC